jgi:hypothetical protein
LYEKHIPWMTYQIPWESYLVSVVSAFVASLRHRGYLYLQGRFSLQPWDNHAHSQNHYILRTKDGWYPQPTPAAFAAWVVRRGKASPVFDRPESMPPTPVHAPGSRKLQDQTLLYVYKRDFQVLRYCQPVLK